nr:PAS domain S-box protein [uncultured Dongia sp.]
MGMASVPGETTNVRDPVADDALMLYRAMLDNAPWGVFHSTADGHYISVNRALATLCGYATQAEMMAAVTDIARQIYVEPGTRVEFLRRMQTDGIVKSFESRMYRADGSIIWVSENTRPVHDSAGNFLYFEGTVEDISRVKLAEEDFRQREAGLRQLINTIGVGVSYWDRNLICRFANDAHQGWAGLGPDDMLGAHLERLMGPERFAAQRAYRDAVFRGEITAFHLPLTTQAGKDVVLQIVLTPDIRAGEVAGYYAVGMDVTALVRAESELAAREQELRLLVNSIPATISYWDRELICRFANDRYSHWYPSKAIVGMHASDFLGEAQFAGDQHRHAAALRGERISFMATMTGDDNVARHLQVDFVPKFEGLEVVGFYAIGTDLTDLKNAEIALRENEERYREVFNNIADAIFLNEVTPDRRFRVLEVNPAAERQMGISAAELVDRCVEEYLPPKTAELINWHFRHCLESGDVHRFEAGLDIVGGHRIMHVTFVPIRDDTGTVRRILGLGRDMTEARELEQAILASEDRERLAHGRLMDAIESLHDGFVLWGPDGRIRMLNRAVTELYFPPGRGFVIGMSYRDAHDQFVHAWRSVGLEPHQVYRAGERMRQFADLAVSDEGMAAFAVDWLATFTGTSPEIPGAYGRWFVIHRQRTREGGFVEFWIDVTERRNRERELHAALHEADAANRAKSRFLAQMSHELRTPLNAVIGFSDLMLRGIAGQMSPVQSEYCGYIHNSGEHLLQLVQGVLDYAAIESEDVKVTLETIDATLVLSQARELMLPIAQKAGVHLSPARTGAAWVHADTLRLRQILINLMANAVKYNRPGGEVRLDILSLPADAWRITVADDGIGIPKERLGELFRPFERLGQEVSGVEGTGLGLVLVHRLAERIGGTVGVESDAGRGSTFWIDLPAAPVPDNG